MKKSAFTMLELVFVIVIAGIIMALAMPSSNDNNLRQAADQVVRHIQYTQHLAMMDDKFDDGDPNWFKVRWQIFFANTQGSGYSWSSMIFADSAGYTGTPDIAEHARNPMDNSRYLSGGYSAGNIDENSSLASQELNLGNKYGIQDVDFTGGCAINIKQERLFFDTLGRPMYGGPHLLDNAYENLPNSMLIVNTCKVELCLSTCTTALPTEKITIAIEPETGYTHIL